MKLATSAAIAALLTAGSAFAQSATAPKSATTMEVLPSTDTKPRELFGVLSLPGFTPLFSRGRPPSGFTHPFRAAAWERSALPQSLAPRWNVRLTRRVWTWAIPRYPCRTHSDKSNSVPDRSVTPDAAGMVLVLLMGSTLLCEMGRHSSPKYRQSQSGRNAAARTLPRSGCPARHA
jgi:hypothetical protein